MDLLLPRPLRQSSSHHPLEPRHPLFYQCPATLDVATRKMLHPRVRLAKARHSETVAVDGVIVALLRTTVELDASRVLVDVILNQSLPLSYPRLLRCHQLRLPLRLSVRPPLSRPQLLLRLSSHLAS
jgi:hypothetical protein